MKHAACTDEPIVYFFPEKGGRGGRDGKAVCARCPVRPACLDFVIDQADCHGIWGGMTERERRRERKRRGINLIGGNRVKPSTDQ